MRRMFGDVSKNFISKLLAILLEELLVKFSMLETVSVLL
jgi:hypothetical protein